MGTKFYTAANILKGTMPFESSAERGYAYKDQGRPVLGWRETHPQVRTLREVGSGRYAHSVCFMREGVDTEIITVAFCQCEGN